MQQAKFTPSLPGIERPVCPRCGTRMMMLARISPVAAADHDKRAFDCPECGNEVSALVQFR